MWLFFLISVVTILLPYYRAVAQHHNFSSKFTKATVIYCLPIQLFVFKMCCLNWHTNLFFVQQLKIILN